MVPRALCCGPMRLCSSKKRRVLRAPHSRKQTRSDGKTNARLVRPPAATPG